MTSITDFRSGTITYRYGARPELFTVSSGAYTSSLSFGAGATPQVSYNGVTRPDGVNVAYSTGTFDSETFSTFRRLGSIVIFNVNIDINIKNNAPTALLGGTATGSQLRIRNLIPSTTVVGGTGVINTPNPISSRSWAPPRSSDMPPVFRDVQIYTLLNGAWEPLSVTTASMPTNIPYDIGARLLSDDTFALYLNEFDKYPSTTYDERPILYEDFNFAADFSPNLDAGSTVRIVIKGEYNAA